ncbi:hypothetical protein BHM03_00049390 [Ensete ventricosum]|nr:hypothetical protein BHM03_00049390 [Ensete ventricosum]
MTGADAKALQALEAMKSHHDFDSTVCLESLGSVRKHFSIPSEYVLHAPRSGQRPYHPCPGGFGISIDALEAGLRFPLHPVIRESRGLLPNCSLSSNSLTNWSKDEMEDDFIRLYHIRVGPRSVMGKVWHISASEVS